MFRKTTPAPSPPPLELVDDMKIDLETTKAAVEHRELVAAGYATTLAALSPEEFARYGRSATRKLDFAVMPILIILFVFNCTLVLSRLNPLSFLFPLTTSLFHSPRPPVYLRR